MLQNPVQPCSSPYCVLVCPCPSQSLLERSDTLHSDLEGVLEASKDLIGHLEPSAACLIQSESRLLSRSVQQLSRTLTGKLGQLQVRLHE